MPRRFARRACMALAAAAACALVAVLAGAPAPRADAPGAGATAAAPPPPGRAVQPRRRRRPRRRVHPPLRRRRRPSRSAGVARARSGGPGAARLRRGVRLPAQGVDFFTWDPVVERAPNRAWRRWGTDRLVRVLLRVLREHRAEFPDAPRVAVGDLSRPRGGDCGPRFGALGHASHQNGLDVDVYYPRLDRLELAPRRPRQVDRALAQDLVDRFVRAGATYVFVGPSLGLEGPRRVVRPLVHHDDHLHARIPRVAAAALASRRCSGKTPPRSSCAG